MALSMEEQRILAEIEEHFTRAEPSLAARLTAFGNPHQSLAGLLRSPRGRLLASLAALALLLLMSMLVYLLFSLRGLPQRGMTGQLPGTQERPAMIALRPGPPAYLGNSSARAVSRAAAPTQSGTAP